MTEPDPPKSSSLQPLPTTSAALSVSGEGGSLFDVWAPTSSPWSVWAKPVLFAQLQKSYQTPPAREAFDVDTALAAGTKDAVVIVDLPGPRSVHVAFAFAQLRGLRPVPLYNGVDAPLPVVDNEPLANSLRNYRDDLLALPIDDAAPPVFMIDSRRLATGAGLSPGKFDNRWMVFPQDFPSGHFLKLRNLSRALVVTTNRIIANDLCHVLLRWQELGVEIHVVEDRADAQGKLVAAPEKTQVSEPSRFRALAHLVLASAGLMRNSAGGFGSVIPEVTHSSGGGYS